MQELTNMTEVDKGTTTKSVQRLIDQGYIRAVQDEADRRVKRLYTTAKAASIMNTIYDCRTEMRSALAKDMDFRSFEQNFEINTWIYDPEFAQTMKNIFLADLEKSSQINLEEWRNRPRLEKFGESWARLFSPLM